ncbi:unnamed protein product [Microthlaspi erraticum]|uniref:Uncharacterized protein n=1 Tax=Microthlaspi erraticum TaxID=1685480 RepID=A0A6D2JR01_9BRAS|nr:unnamed protein product [Microthlaspi erraticum]
MSAGTLPLGSATKGSNNHPLINSPCDDFRRENDKLSKDIPPHKPLRDVNQILSILQRPTVTETCFDNNLKTSMPSTEVPPESDMSKNDIMESVSSRGTSKNSLPQQFMVRESSTTTHLSDPPSFDLGI